MDRVGKTKIISYHNIAYKTYNNYHTKLFDNYYDGVTDLINEVLNKKDISDKEFTIKFLSTDTLVLPIDKEDCVKVITNFYFELTEYE